MKRFAIFALTHIFMAFMLLACGQADKTTLPPSGPAVGIERYQWVDETRQNWNETGPRPIVTTLWYPAAKTSEMAEIGIPPSRPVFIGGYGARGAEFIDSPSTFPLILLSHGTGGAAMQMMWLGRELAAEGYIVAAVDHHGNTAAEESFDPRGFRMPWERARDMSAVLDSLLGDQNWGPHIDKERIGAAGFSLGGYTVTALIGGKADFDKFQAFCESKFRDATCEEQSENPNAAAEFQAMIDSNPALARRMADAGNDFSDSRFRAAMTFAPALAQVFTDESLESINTPYLTIVGTEDKVAPASTNAEHLASRIKGAELIKINGANHYAFLNLCNRRGQKYVAVCKDEKGFERSNIHAQSLAEASAFFSETLKK